jgi:hypothetical protein
VYGLLHAVRLALLRLQQRLLPDAFSESQGKEPVQGRLIPSTQAKSVCDARLCGLPFEQTVVKGAGVGFTLIFTSKYSLQRSILVDLTSCLNIIS